MKKFELLAASAIALLVTLPAAAQTATTTSAENSAPTNGPGQEQSTQDAQADQAMDDIIVTAQRQSQRLQDVPIAVTAFTADNLVKQQIQNPSNLQATLPNVTFTKTNFTTSSFTIRGIGDLCTGTTCDSATAIHVNDMPVQNSRLFETEFFDLERIEVLRGPQGTLFGRNATSGVVNFITAKPDLSGIRAAGEFEYGNYDSKRARAMFNLPFTDTLGIRVAGTYLNRDGYTRNLYDGQRIDDRDLYALRGTLSWEPSADTRLDLIGYYFHEKDNRSRIQKQLCHRDPTGVLGCLPDRLGNETVNGNNFLPIIQTSREFLSIASASSGGTLGRFGLGSIYGTDPFAGVVNPTDPRTVRTDVTPTYFADEEQYMGKFFHDFGRVSLNVTGGYQRSAVKSRTDYTLAVQSAYVNNPGLLALDALGRRGSPFAFLDPVRQALIPNGANGGVCQSDVDETNVGVYGGKSIGCFAQSLDYDQSSQRSNQYSVEAHLDSQFDGAFNFLLGGIYYDTTTHDNSYYVSSFGLDYVAGILGAANTRGAAYFGSPFININSHHFRLKSWGGFGEAYFETSDRLKLTLGLRYNHDDKFVRAHTTYLQDATGTFVAVPFGASDFTSALNYGALDFDAAKPGAQPFAENGAKFNRLTGRAVVDYKITPENMLYASYSRGYKSGGINPPLSPIFQVPATFAPEKVDAFELGSKNTFLSGQLRLNLTGFYYKYKSLQLSRIVARTSVNDNVNADIYGIEAEAVVSPVPALQANFNFSYLHSKVTNDKFLSNPRDPSGGRSDAVIIKDIQSTSNCAVVASNGSAALANAYVAAVNRGIGAGAGDPNLLHAPTPVPGTRTTGAFSSCTTLARIAAGNVQPSAGGLYVLQQNIRGAFGVPTGALPFTVLSPGVNVNIKGSELPLAPNFKWSAGIQYIADIGSSGWTIVPRADVAYTGDSFGVIFNTNPDRIRGYEVVNAQIQLNAPDDRFYLRAFVQNLTKNDAVTGLYVTDQSSGLFTNVFTIEPRRYGVAAGFKF